MPLVSSTSRPRKTRIPNLRLVRETAILFDYDTAVPVRSPRDVVALMQAFAAREVAESFWLLALDSQHRVIDGPITITRGILNSSLVHPREVFRAAIVAGAAALILCHNHPSGDPTPSADDRMVTDQLVAAGRLLDMPVHDHIIVAGMRYVSFAEAGLL